MPHHQTFFLDVHVDRSEHVAIVQVVPLASLMVGDAVRCRRTTPWWSQLDLLQEGDDDAEERGGAAATADAPRRRDRNRWW